MGVEDFLYRREIDSWFIHLGKKDPGEMEKKGGIVTGVGSEEGGDGDSCSDGKAGATVSRWGFPFSLEAWGEHH